MSSEDQTVGRDQMTDDRAPLFGSWRRAYVVAFAIFAAEVVLLYAFTVAFA